LKIVRFSDVVVDVYAWPEFGHLGCGQLVFKFECVTDLNSTVDFRCGPLNNFTTSHAENSKAFRQRTQSGQIERIKKDKS
jgi:hypothetical protein